MLIYADLSFQGMDLGIDESGSSRSRRGSRIAPGTIIFTAPPDHLDFSCFSIIVMHCVRLIVVFLSSTRVLGPFTSIFSILNDFLRYD